VTYRSVVSTVYQAIAPAVRHTNGKAHKIWILSGEQRLTKLLKASLPELLVVVLHEQQTTRDSASQVLSDMQARLRVPILKRTAITVPGSEPWQVITWVTLSSLLRQEIARELQDVSRVADGVRRVTDAGLVHRLDDFVFPTRTARRADEIEVGTV
jgi:hypothetical protein